MPIVSANGIELAYDSFGDESGPAILLISGLGTQMIRWMTPFCVDLANRGYRVVRFDNRDSGRSTHFTQSVPPDLGALGAALAAGQRPDVPYSLYDMAADAMGLLDVLSIAHAHVVGRSMGGMIAQVMASEYPDRVLSLTSIMSSTGNPSLPQAAPEVMAAMMRPGPDPFSDEEGFLAHSSAVARLFAGTEHPFDEDEHRRLVREELRRGYDPTAAARQIAAMAVAGDRRSRLATITAPTLIIHGKDDPLIPPACGEDTAASVPHSELMMLDGMGHELPPRLYAMVAGAIQRTAEAAQGGAPIVP